MIGHVPDFQWNGPITYYGSTGLVKRVSETPNNGALLWFDPVTHQPTWYGPRYGEAYLNHGARCVRLCDFLEETHDPHGRFFVRPNSGLKVFAGKVYDHIDLKRFVDLSTNNTLLSMDTEIMVNQVHEIEREFRTWIVNGECVAAVQYKVGCKMWSDSEVPQEVRDFASTQAKVCSPSPVFVLDVAQTPEGLKLIEINCFHSAGFYRTEHILDVVAEVSNYVRKTL